MKGGDGMGDDNRHAEIMAEIARKRADILAEMNKSRGDSDAGTDNFIKLIKLIAQLIVSQQTDRHLSVCDSDYSLGVIPIITNTNKEKYNE